MDTSRNRARILAREQTGERVGSMLEILDERDPSLRRKLRDGAVAELSSWPDLAITYISAEATLASCSIAGAYIDSVDPPQIGIVEGSFSRRESFTALHELGHHLQRTQDRLVDALPQQPDRGRILEEMTSDAFAAAILLPDELVSSALGTGTPTATQVKELWKAGGASRAAVCVKAAQNLASPGHVMLLDADGAIEFCATHADFPLRRGLDQSGTEVVRAARDSDAAVVSRKSHFRYAAGALGQELYAQATDLDGHLLVVAVVDGAPWERLALSSTERRSFDEWHQCANCGHVERSYGLALCDICGEPKCEECGRCACPSRVAERLCESCFLMKPAHQFIGDAPICVDC